MQTFSPVLISNMALSNIGIGQEIGDLLERSGPARACNLWYEIARDLALSSFEWPFATKQVALALYEEDPNTEWRYSYHYPDSCVIFRRIITGCLPEVRSVPFKLTNDDAQGILIWTNEQEAIGEMTGAFENSGLWAAAFASAVAWLLAERIAPKLQVDRSRQLDATGYMDKALMQAKGIQSQEMAHAPRPPAASVQARNGCLLYSHQRGNWRSFPDPLSP